MDSVNINFQCPSCRAGFWLYLSHMQPEKLQACNEQLQAENAYLQIHNRGLSEKLTEAEAKAAWGSINGRTSGEWSWCEEGQ